MHELRGGLSPFVRPAWGRRLLLQQHIRSTRLLLEQQGGHPV